ncbi:minor tail protein Z (GPZ) [Hydrogenoanaerobacterium saccharovorans]|uniref:Prophage minor tail protein Z (GPZ) n=1 Tax=Hydrogenoanaerobacterium saccharovorans TaxID=474960 RepID=A0A1H8A038_9FIRM|nr:phage tail protein [Hydrogenoanaerobacterium saccharovorans]RPF48256.1 minor tail protein Z (GPZ) [Hydrogenoanaerobacterium saccharovorans]SEM63941.1 Prophage minor tail protein Z (GPZ) [Hydrogenoanaerobacterium saccharovorans]
MIKITNEQIERVSLILGNIPNGTEKALSNIISRGNATTKTEVVKQITSVYAITQKSLRAETTINMRTRKEESGIVGTVTFSGYKLPLYRFNVSPTMPVKTKDYVPVKTETGWRMYRKSAPVKAAVKKSNTQTLFQDAFVATMMNGHTGIFERKGRHKITEHMGLSTAQMARNSVVLEQVEQVVQETVNKRIEHEITRILNGYV